MDGWILSTHSKLSLSTSVVDKKSEVWPNIKELYDKEKMSFG